MVGPGLLCESFTLAGAVCGLYLALLSYVTSHGSDGGISFGLVEYTIQMGDVRARMRFDWIGAYAFVNGTAVNGNGFHDGSATWFSYDEEEWAHSKSDDKVKDMWKGCSQTCPLSFFSGLLSLLLVIATPCVPKWKRDGKLGWGRVVIAIVGTLCGVTSLLAFGLGCYSKVTAEGAGFTEDVFERKMGGGAGFVVAIIATVLSAILTVKVFVSHLDAYLNIEVAGPGVDVQKPRLHVASVV